MKVYRGTQQVLKEAQRALSAKPLVPGVPAPLAMVAEALRAGRQYSRVAIYLAGKDGLVLEACSGEGAGAGTELARQVMKTGKPEPLDGVLSRRPMEIALPIELGGQVAAVLETRADATGFAREDQMLLKEVARRLRIFLSERGKYLCQRARLLDSTRSQRRPQMSAGTAARRAAAGER